VVMKGASELCSARQRAHFRGGIGVWSALGNERIKREATSARQPPANP
jgi:hypothetical protein